MNADVAPLAERNPDPHAPLHPEEERRAIEAALAARHGPREDFRVRGAELLIVKPPRRDERPARQVRVLLTRRTESVVHEVLVDAEGRVIADRDLGPRSLPYQPDEIDQARAVAESDTAVNKHFGDYPIGFGTFAPMLETARSSRHRLVGLHFLDLSNPDVPRPLVSVVVDLASGRLIHEIHHGQGPGRG